MNNLLTWQTTVTTHDPARAAIWTQIFGSNRAPVKSPIPTLCNLPEKGEQLCYHLDLGALTRPQFEALCTYISKKFGYSYDFILDELRDKGMPIPVADCTFTSTDSGLMFSLLDWPIDDEYNWLSQDDSEEEYF